MIIEFALAALAAIIGAGSGYYIRQQVAIRSANSIEQKTKKSLEEAEEKAKQRVSIAEREAKDIVGKADSKAAVILEEAKKDERDRKASIERTEDRLLKKEEMLSAEAVDIKVKIEELKTKSAAIETSQAEVVKMKLSMEAELSRMSGLTKEEAKERLFVEARESAKEDLLHMMQKLEKEKKDEVEKKSIDIISTAIQRYSRSHVADITTTAFTLPSEDIKGKIIGREGRNIRTLERLTGVEFIMDETPDTILITSFDPIRREIAKMSLEKLIQDGRIQPAKIEEKVAEATAEIDRRTQEIGEEAIYDVGVLNLPKEIVHLLGRLHFRTSYGQNVLTHSIEVAHIAGMIAEELGVSAEIAKKGALLHDIGKAIDHEVTGNHVDLGVKILRKYGVDERVIQAMQSHHDDYPFAIPEAFIVAAADIISAARPGARRGTLEQYIRRLEDLEKIASEFSGVKQSYAVSAGRELRVFVVPEKIDDFAALQMAKNIASKIETDMKYPGDIKVTVVRELRAVEYAR